MAKIFHFPGMPESVPTPEEEAARLPFPTVEVLLENAYMNNPVGLVVALDPATGVHAWTTFGNMTQLTLVGLLEALKFELFSAEVESAD